MENIDNMTVAEVVSSNIKTADVFKKNGIDFCCGGNVKVNEICAKKGVNYDLLKRSILELDQIIDKREDYNSWELDFLADYIVNMHHNYVKEANNLIEQYASKVAKVHGHYYTEAIEIYELFQSISHELNMHMHKEEMILFPYIKHLAKVERDETSFEQAPFGTVRNPIQMMHHEHDDAGDIIKKIATLSNDFTPPEGACNTFKALYAKLEEYQDDLFQHIHLENNILFPKAIEAEAKYI